jgi:hypothetical protein
MDPEINYRIHNIPPLVPVLSQTYAVHIPPPNFFETHFNIVVYLLRARTVEPQKQLFLSNTHTQQWNKRVMQPTSRQRLGKHTSEQAQWRHNPTVRSYYVTCVFCVVCATQQ